MTLSHRDASELVQLMEGTTAGAQLHQRCPDERVTHRNGYRGRVLTTQVGDFSCHPQAQARHLLPQLAGAAPQG